MVQTSRNKSRVFFVTNIRVMLLYSYILILIYKKQKTIEVIVIYKLFC